MAVLDQPSPPPDGPLHDWLSQRAGRFVILTESAVIGAFSTMEEAQAEGERRFGAARFVVSRVDPALRPLSEDKRWQQMEREADEDIAAGRVARFDDLESFIADLLEG